LKRRWAEEKNCPQGWAMAGKRWAQKNHGAEEKTILRKDVSMGMGNGKGECGLGKMMGQRENVSLERK
jgi:hypothetical protein